MATRIYLPSSGAPPVAPTWDGAWGVVTGADRVWAVAGLASGTSMGSRGHAETLEGAGNVLSRQYLWGPLGAGEIAGTVKGRIRADASAADCDHRAQIVLRVVSADGTTVRGTLRAADSEVLSSAFATNFANRAFPLVALEPQALTPVVAQDGDWLVIEIGYHTHNATATSKTSTFRYGDSAASDLPEDETERDDDNPWIEFSQDIPVNYVALRQILAEAASLATGQQVLFRQILAEVGHYYSGGEQEVRLRQAVAEVAWVEATGTIYAVGNDLGEYAGDERGVPLASDRAAWDDMDYPALHARDLKDGHSIHHLPANPDDGDAALWDATLGEWLPRDVLTPAKHTAIGDGAPHHARAHNLDSETDHPDVENAAKADGYVLVWRDMAGKHVYEAQAGGGPAPATPAGYAENIGNGVSKSFTVTHNLGTFDVIVQVYDTSLASPEQVSADVGVVDLDTIQVSFEIPPSPLQYRVLVIATVTDVPDPVTLSAEAADVLALTDQKIDLETQAANTVLAGPDAGADAKPTFRPLVEGDLPSHSHPAPDAGDVTYTPAVATDWAGDADPGDVDNALDQLAERVDDLEATPPGGVSTFVGLTDTPSSYAGMKGRIPYVKQDETGLEFL